MKNLGNVPKKGTENIVVWSLFNKKPRKFTKHSQKQNRVHGTTQKAKKIHKTLTKMEKDSRNNTNILRTQTSKFS